MKRSIPWGWISAGLLVGMSSLMLIMKGSDANVQYYMTVSEYVQQKDAYLGKKVKLAGKVIPGSLQKSLVPTSGGQTDRYEFVVEDLGRQINVRYDGLAPDTFKDDSEVVIEGRPDEGDLFVATHLMAKCASKYTTDGMPPLEAMRDRSVTFQQP